jgi:hypothetical protein
VQKADSMMWFTCRKRFGIMPDHRAPLHGRRSALESMFRKFGDRKTDYVVAPEQGMEFDSLQEAYDFYNLYSWELGFGIRYGSSKLNPSKCRIAQDIVCGCAVCVSYWRSFFVQISLHQNVYNPLCTWVLHYISTWNVRWVP